MSDLDQLLDRAQRMARIPDRRRALRWLRAVASTLADWGGDDARRLLKEALPSRLLRGSGTRGAHRTWERALEAAGEGVEDSLFFFEVGHRVVEPDPGKLGVAVRPLLALLREELTAEQAEKLAASLPEPVARDLREASTDPPWPYALVPQPFGPGRHQQRERDRKMLERRRRDSA